MTVIDAHQHYWNPARGDYGWMPQDDPILSRTYAPADLKDARVEGNVTHTVLVQAAPSVEETEYLLGVADASPSVAKVVGWINFEDPAQYQVLKRLAAHPKFAGVRPMIQDLPDDQWMLRPDVQWAYKAIVELDLTFDCLGFPQHLPHFHTLLTRYPDMRAVIDHCMKPQIRSHSADNLQFWADGISRLAEGTNACCKLSGLVTECGDGYSEALLQPYVHHVINVFGADRIMWGSDWPVVRLKCEYKDWLSTAKVLTTHLQQTEIDMIFARTARAFYQLK